MDMYLNNSGARDTIAMLQAMALLGIGFLAWCWLVDRWDAMMRWLRHDQRPAVRGAPGPGAGGGPGLAAPGSLQENHMLTATVTYYQATSSGVQRVRRRFTFDPHCNDLDGVDASHLTITQYGLDLDRHLARTPHLGGYWFIAQGDRIIANSSGYRAPLQPTTAEIQDGHNTHAHR